jgi:hypothetical protein
VDAPIASFEAIGIDSERGRFPVKVTIGAPYLSRLEPDTWRCAVSIDPLYPHLRDIAGGDAFQSLCLASRLAVDLLQSYIEKGGRLTYDGENDVSLDAYIPLRPKS